MAGTVDTLRESTSVPDDRKKRAVLGAHKDKRQSLRTVGQKIKKLKKEGKPQKQAEAIALSMKRRGKLRA